MSEKQKIRFVLGEKQLFKLSQNNVVQFKINDQVYEIAVPPWITLEMFILDPNQREPIRLEESHLDRLSSPESDRKKMN